ncbi:hypothetical protein [Streptodolium elevatio]
MVEQVAGAGGADRARAGAGGDAGAETSTARPVRRGAALFGLEDGDLLPDATADERDGGWGDERGAGGASDAADLRRFLDEKPPHHL